ncbi:MAG: LacI family DNA-binding transcriptional regulator [Liquorilactobacillus nagelii]|uniref:LacI family transcriptional regulator n=1 Tax=Liquorilactobacillus nagelii TaxID=82688 RepID=A0A3Q8CC03_9LACO|nr:LacI family DNA-binding transcriptional regulator [Liquorilactobacillus nagelii]AUJ31683.1 LacI family transcriptional regulator [Liquorilactobacillus nagelii]KRL40442.1 sucrose operon repressor [Liquorilactobacillus nagelii DSM 13675]MCC7615950.1 LacI family transcriptional regulator [Liquorilactobacillus nagelii]MCI1633117.1 LacI family DNA-binding transcriptional regulator [Liquorilactobacillus nagelii]MCI1700598.1 LacI family DNA-binding transcriptional regulator [Liquorilactobacillus n
MRPKLTDVAARSGVSVTTVSRVINNYGYLSQQTKDKVFQAMRDLNYQPNSLARSLHGKKTLLIGVIFPSITNPFFAELVERIENRLFNQNYKIILCNSADNKEKERDYLRMLIANQVDGIIAGTHNLGIDEYNKVGLPIVSFDRRLSDKIPIVSSDNLRGTALATQELYQAGARHIYFLGNPHQIGNPTDLRLQGYQQTITKLKLTPHIHAVAFDESPTLKSLSIKKMLTQHHADGIVCTDDLTAILVLQAAQKLGIAVPQSLKVVGFDGTAFIQEYHPELSTIVQPIDDLASLLVNLLVERIDHADQPLEQMQYVLPVKLLRSQSTFNLDE